MRAFNPAEHCIDSAMRRQMAQELLQCMTEGRKDPFIGLDARARSFLDGLVKRLLDREYGISRDQFRWLCQCYARVSPRLRRHPVGATKAEVMRVLTER